MEPGGYAYVKTQIAKVMGFKENTTNEAELSLVDSFYVVQLMVVNKLAEELQECMTVHISYGHDLMSEEGLRSYQLSGRRKETNGNKSKQ
jgi:hypothetical protein